MEVQVVVVVVGSVQVVSSQRCGEVETALPMGS